MIISSSPPTTRPPSGLEPSETAPSERSPNPIATLPSHGRSPDFFPKKTSSDLLQSAGKNQAPPESAEVCPAPPWWEGLSSAQGALPAASARDVGRSLFSTRFHPDCGCSHNLLSPLHLMPLQPGGSESGYCNRILLKLSRSLIGLAAHPPQSCQATWCLHTEQHV